MYSRELQWFRTLGNLRVNVKEISSSYFILIPVMSSFVEDGYRRNSRRRVSGVTCNEKYVAGSVFAQNCGTSTETQLTFSLTGNTQSD